MGVTERFSRNNICIFFVKMIKTMPLQAFYMLLGTIINAALPAVQTLAVAEFINNAERIFQGAGLISEIIGPLTVMIAIICFQNLMPSVENMVNESSKNRLKLVLKEKFVRKQTLLKYYYIEDEASCALIHRVCEALEMRFERGFQNICEGIGLVVKCGSLLGIVMQASWISGMAIFAVSIPLFYIAMRTGEKNYSLQSDALEIKRRYEYLADVLTNRECAKERAVFGYNAHIEKEYDSYCEYANQKEAQIEKKKYANMKSGSLITLVLGIIIMFLLLPELQAGRISRGLYVGLVSAVLGLVQSMSWDLSGIMREYAGTKAYLKDADTFWNMEEKENADVEPQEIPDFQLQTIEFRHVSFRYPGAEEYVLRDCSFVLQGDKCYSVVGRNGAGKSTITKLLMGLYDDFEGEILINGRALHEYHYAEIKWLISVVFQDYARYALSVKENILLGNVNCQDFGLLEQIVQELELDEFVQKLPGGLDTVLGKVEEGSTDLSGGQWQKLAIARLLYSEAPINILDEPTAAIDALEENNLYQSFQKMCQGCTAIIVTHRLASAQIAERIIVMKDGRIVQDGRHEELVEVEGEYKRMYELQKKWYT